MDAVLAGADMKRVVHVDLVDPENAPVLALDFTIALLWMLFARGTAFAVMIGLPLYRLNTVSLAISVLLLVRSRPRIRVSNGHRIRRGVGTLLHYSNTPTLHCLAFHRPFPARADVSTSFFRRTRRCRTWKR